MTRLDSFLFGLALVGFCGALAIADDMPREIPDDSITPGVIASTNQSEVCGFVNGLSYSKRHRATPYDLKTKIRARDGCDPHNSEVDHRLPLALGGADVEANLWCEPAPSYHRKDELETWAWEQVCKRHTMALGDAQAIFLPPNDWRREYLDAFGSAP